MASQLEVIELLSDGTLSEDSLADDPLSDDPLSGHGARRASTPEFPSADELLGTGGSRTQLAGGAASMDRRAALELPSSPPPVDSRGSSPESQQQEEYSDGEDSYRVLDAIINAGRSSAGWSALETGGSAGSGLRVFGRPAGPAHALAAPEYSDAVETVVLDSSDDDTVSRLQQSRTQLLSRRAVSADPGPPTDPPVPSSLLRRSESHSVASDLGSSSIGQPWSAADSHGSLSQAVTRREQQGERARIADRRRVERAAEKQQAAVDREFARTLSQTNKKTLDPVAVARDAAMVVDPGVLALLPAKKHPAEVPVPAPEDHELFARFRDDGMAVRVIDGGTPCAIRWEVTRRREWNARLGLFVPLDPPRVVRAAQAMVVLSSARFVALVSAAQLTPMLEIWRASLATTRLLVVVLGLQLLLRKAATADAQEFARQMRAYIKQGAVDGASGQQQQQQQQQAIGADDVRRAVLEVQIRCPWVTWFTECAADARSLGKLLRQTTTDLALAERSDGRAEPAADSTEPEAAGGFITGEVAASLRVATVRSGADLPDAWVRALTQIPKVTQPMAQAIAAHYPTPRCLFAAWRRLPAPSDRELLLANLSVASAAATGRRIGAAMSTRIYRVFNEPDPARPLAEL
ncbi:hypothetical protein H4R19_004494 [Coemansia spiralis]|nr:hypothetical protein H4R19_004494 [Coemansia spiralis]